MRGFDDVTLSWNGEEKTVPADDVFEMVFRIEQALHDGGQVPVFMRLMQRDYTTSQLAKGYAAALAYAGHRVRPQDVYLSIESGMADNDVSRIETIHTATVSLLSIVAPNIHDSVFKSAEGGEKK